MGIHSRTEGRGQHQPWALAQPLSFHSNEHMEDHSVLTCKDIKHRCTENQINPTSEQYLSFSIAVNSNI